LICRHRGLRAVLQKPYGSIGADLWRGESSGCMAIVMISPADLRLFILIPFGLALLAMLWILWRLLREGKKR
jgi:hypothetical protein